MLNIAWAEVARRDLYLYGWWALKAQLWLHIGGAVAPALTLLRQPDEAFPPPRHKRA